MVFKQAENARKREESMAPKQGRAVESLSSNKQSLQEKVQKIRQQLDAVSIQLSPSERNASFISVIENNVFNPEFSPAILFSAIERIATHNRIGLYEKLFASTLLKQHLLVADTFLQLLKFLPKDQRIHCCETIINPEQLKSIITDPQQLSELLSVLPDNHRLNFCVHRIGCDQVRNLAVNTLFLTWTLEELPDEERLAFYTTHLGLGWLATIIKSRKDFESLINLLPPNQRAILIAHEKINDKLDVITRTIDDLLKIIDCIPEEDRYIFYLGTLGIEKLLTYILLKPSINKNNTNLEKLALLIDQLPADHRHNFCNKPTVLRFIQTHLKSPDGTDQEKRIDSFCKIVTACGYLANTTLIGKIDSQIIRDSIYSVKSIIQLLNSFPENHRLMFLRDTLGKNTLKKHLSSIKDPQEQFSALKNLTTLFPPKDRLNFLIHDIGIPLLNRIANRNTDDQVTLCETLDDQKDFVLLVVLMDAFVEGNIRSSDRIDAYQMLGEHPHLFRIAMNQHSITSLNRQDKLHQTGLIYAILAKQTALAWALLVRGVNTSIKNGILWGDTAYDVAKDMPSMQDLLPMLDPNIEKHTTIQTLNIILSQLKSAPTAEQKSQLYDEAHEVIDKLKYKLPIAPLRIAIFVKMHQLIEQSYIQQANMLPEGNKYRNEWLGKAKVSQTILLEKQDWQKVQAMWQRPATPTQETKAHDSKQTSFWKQMPPRRDATVDYLAPPTTTPPLTAKKDASHQSSCTR